MCTVLLPPGDNTIAVNKYIIYHTTRHGKKVRRKSRSNEKQGIRDKQLPDDLKEATGCCKLK